MKRSLVVLTSLVLVLALAACSTVTAPGTAGVVTKVEGNSVTVAAAGGAETTYTVTSSTNVYAPDGVSTQRSYLAAGQRVMVWANGANTAVRINVEP